MPSQDRYTTPASAFSACAVQMLWVAFSRRMCCSRVCRVSTKPRLPSASSVSPAIRPHLAYEALAAAKNLNEAAEVEPLPSDWPSPTHTSTPQSPGGLRTPSGSGSAAHTNIAPVDLPASAKPAVLDGAEEVRLLHEDGRGVVVDGSRERLQIGRAGAVERHLDTSMP